MTDLLTLRAGALHLSLDPATGGSIAAFDWVDEARRVPILRGCSESGGEAKGEVLAMGNFPLVPFVNRIRGGEFDFRGRTVRLARNMASDASPLHGQGWLGEWQVAQASTRAAVLIFDHPAGEWPWAYRAEQSFDLDERGLTLVLTCRNDDDQPMPCGLGQHPYFHCTGATRIATEVRDVWTIDADVLPVERVPATGQFDLADRSVCGLGLDHGFAGWGGSARLSDPAWPFTITMSSSDAEFFQLYSPDSGGIFVAEPVTHANAALNQPEEQWPDLGLQILAPGESMSLTMRLEIS